MRIDIVATSAQPAGACRTRSPVGSVNPTAQRKATLDAAAAPQATAAGAKAGAGDDDDTGRTPRANVGVGLSFSMRPKGGFVVASVGEPSFRV